jgi:signal transduction histidine kinase/CheY-like chemotaxis protein
MANTFSESELIWQNPVFNSLVRLINNNAENLDDFLHLLLEVIVKQSGGSRGYFFKVFENKGSFDLVEMIIQPDNGRFCENNKSFELIKAGPWIQAFEQKKLIVMNTESALFPTDGGLFEMAGRFCSFPVRSGNSINAVLVSADKETDYDSDDLSLGLLIDPVSILAENFRKFKELTIAKETAEKNERRKISYLSNLSHEIKTPVNAIAGFTQLLKEDDLNAGNRQKFLDIILENSNDLVSIINNVTEISNIESGLSRISDSEVHLSDIFKELYEQFKEEASRKNLILQHEIRVSGNDMNILTDRTRLLQMLSALLSNALKFTFTGKIVFGCTLRNGFLEFYVSDTGIGIPKVEMDKVFDHFFQDNDSILKSFKGAGLGLTISKALAEKMGGKIWVDSTEGKGSVFHFTIPHKKSEIVSATTIPLVHDNLKERRKKIILVAEDDSVNFMLIRNFLSALDVVLLRAVNGKEAVDICLSENVDLVLMDIKMPVMDGFTAIKIIRESNPDQIIIAQTAYTNDRQTALDKGCNDFIAKPFGKVQILNLVKSYLSLE